MKKSEKVQLAIELAKCQVTETRGSVSRENCDSGSDTSQGSKKIKAKKGSLCLATII
jgi:hypothetical protein